MDRKITYIYYEETDSTQLCLKRMLQEGGAEPFTVVSAGHQNAGRGRRGRTWQSPVGTSVSTSMILFPGDIPMERLSMITLIAAVAVAEAIEGCSGLNCMIKWPNDVVINGKKVCGILTETATKGPEIAAIIGIGINVHMDSFPEDISDMATSIDMELRRENIKKQVHRQDIISRVWTIFAGCYKAFSEGDCSFMDPYKKRLVNLGRAVVAMGNDSRIEGKCVGVDDTGALLIETDDGVLAVNAGEVSVRGLYGYI